MISVPLAMKTGVCTIIFEGHLSTTYRMTVLPTSNSLSQGASRPHHLGPSCTSKGHFISCVPGSKDQGSLILQKERSPGRNPFLVAACSYMSLREGWDKVLCLSVPQVNYFQLCSQDWLCHSTGCSVIPSGSEAVS